MKPRTYWALVLILGVIFGVFLWQWIMTPAGTVVPAKPKVGAKVAPPSLPEVEAVPVVNANNGSKSRARHAPVVPKAPEVVVQTILDTELAVPLEQAEHHAYSDGMFTYDVSVTRVHRVKDAQGQYTVEFVDMHVWQSNGVAQVTGMGQALRTFSAEDQAYIKDWARKQAALAAGQAETVPSP